MGYFLVRESMFDSVIHARDRWLKPNGMMYALSLSLSPVNVGTEFHLMFWLFNLRETLWIFSYLQQHWTQFIFGVEYCVANVDIEYSLVDFTCWFLL
jgi:hypothetical protein